MTNLYECAVCTQPYPSLLASAECAEFDRAEDAEHRRGAGRATRRLQARRWPGRDDDD